MERVGEEEFMIDYQRKRTKMGFSLVMHHGETEPSAND
jgi:hypothetical protein